MMPGFIEPHLHPLIAAVILSGDIIAPHDWNVPDGCKERCWELIKSLSKD